MKIFNRIIAICLCICFVGIGILIFPGCDVLEGQTTEAVQHETNQKGEPYKLSFVAEFYDNSGQKWLTSSGSSFDISPNKVKEYSYDNDGSWISSWTTSSVVSVKIDNNNIETCGSTVLIYDNYLVKQDCVLPTSSTDTSNEKAANINTPNDIRFSDYWTIDWWWKTKDTRNYSIGEKIVMIQSQNGNPICLFSGKSVSWELSRNLPKTTEITIDNAKLYIHRANFAVIDKSLFTEDK